MPDSSRPRAHECPRRRTVTTNPAHLYVEAVGSGPPLVLLHGFALHGGVFSPIVPALAERHRVLVVDLPGHGLSGAPMPDTLEATADAVDRALDVDGPLDVLGWSFGGLVALAWARQSPDRVSRLVLAATAPSFVARDDFVQAMPLARLEQFGDELRVAYRLTLKLFLTLQVQGSEEGRRTLSALRATLFARGDPSPATLTGTLRLLASADLRKALPEIRTKALVISGERDTLAYRDAGAALARLLPDARFTTIPGAAHAPFLSHRAAFLHALDSFLDAR